MTDERLQSFRRLLAEAEPPAFEPFFAARVVRRLTDEVGGDALYRGLRRMFVRVAVAGTLTAAAIAVYSLTDVGELEIYGSLVEALLGLPTPSLETALALWEV